MTYLLTGLGKAIKHNLYLLFISPINFITHQYFLQAQWKKWQNAHFPYLCLAQDQNLASAWKLITTDASSIVNNF